MTKSILESSRLINKATTKSTLDPRGANNYAIRLDTSTSDYFDNTERSQSQELESSSLTVSDQELRQPPEVMEKLEGLRKEQVAMHSSFN